MMFSLSMSTKKNSRLRQRLIPESDDTSEVYIHYISISPIWQIRKIINSFDICVCFIILTTLWVITDIDMWSLQHKILLWCVCHPKVETLLSLSVVLWSLLSLPNHKTKRQEFKSPNSYTRQTTLKQPEHYFRFLVIFLLFSIIGSVHVVSIFSFLCSVLLF